MLLKIENLRFAEREEPQLRFVDTVNSDSNAPMLRVNLALGFAPVRAWSEWELASSETNSAPRERQALLSADG